jgi:hypothetical protein
MDSEASPEQSAPPLSARDYRMFRWALLLPLSGAFLSPVLAGVLSGLPVPERVHEVLGSMVTFILMTLGLLTLRTLREDARYRMLIDLALGGSVAAVMAAGMIRLMKSSAGLHVAELFTALGVLFFVLALRRLVAETNWAEELRRRLRTSAILVAVLLVGSAAFLIPLSLLNPTPQPAFEKSGYYFLILLLQVVPTLQLLRVLRDLYRDAGLRNNVLVIRGRRSKKD